MWNKLQTFLRKHKLLAIAFSGGLDSRFLAYAAKQAGCEILLLHATGPHIPPQESAYAKAWAKEQDLDLKCIEVDVLSIAEVKNNSEQRCYYCKKYLLTCFKHVAKNLTLCDGTNADDIKSHRPGLRALKELDITSPLAECGINKESIRQLAVQMGLDKPDQKARPCLLTRLNYNLTATPAILERIAKAELELEHAGLTDFRLRLCPKPILQTLPHSISSTHIEQILTKHGFERVKIGISNQISGFFDQKT